MKQSECAEKKHLTNTATYRTYASNVISHMITNKIYKTKYVNILKNKFKNKFFHIF